ncbi:hypothetical protein IW150_002332, partial [Coemansia sp. RSA 2607]
MDPSSNFPPTFHAFLSSNAIPPSIYALHAQLPRYIRILNHTNHTPASLTALTLQLSEKANCTVTPTGLPGFLAIPDPTVRLSQLQTNQVVGMDISSGIAAYALDCHAGDNVLDLCCAPGAKLLLLAELVGPRGSVTGVDVADHRLATCRRLVAKHARGARASIRLYLADGTQFDERAPAPGWWDPEVLRRSAQGKPAVRRPWHAGKLLRSAYACSGKTPYDRVLVDAECTHDGSLAHVLKYARLGWAGLEQIAQRAPAVPQLQLRLMENAWRLLRVGGLMVYSTCSLSPEQNEMVVARFLE